MYVLMEEFTNLSNYPVPKDTRLIKNIIAENDGYIIRAGVPTMQQVWPGTTVEVSEKSYQFPISFGSRIVRYFFEIKAEIALFLPYNYSRQL